MPHQRATSLVLLLATAGGLQAAPASPAPRASASPTPPPAALDSAYSQRARRRAQALLRLRLLELREAGLERVREAIERHLPVDSLFDPVPGPGSAGREH